MGTVCIDILLPDDNIYNTYIYIERDVYIYIYIIYVYIYIYYIYSYIFKDFIYRLDIK